MVEFSALPTSTRRAFLGATAALALAGIGSRRVAAYPSPARTRKTVRAGTSEETTVHVYDSGVPGPSMFVLGGVHGNETAGYRAADDVATWSVRKGRLVVIPRANRPAIRAGTREGLTGDLNRQFLPLSTPVSPLARALWNEVTLAGPNLFVDMHESKGLYAEGNLGQSLGYYPVKNAADAAGAAIGAVNDIISDTRYRFRRRVLPTPLQDPKGPLVVRASFETGAAAYMVETYLGQSLDARIAQQKRVVRTLIDECVASFAPPRGWNSLVVDGSGSTVSYEFAVTGVVRKCPERDPESEDLVLGDHVTSTVSASDGDAYEYTGNLMGFVVTGGDPRDVSVFVKGERRTLGSLLTASRHELRVVGNGTRTDYEVGVSGTLVKRHVEPVGLDNAIWDGRATGYVVSGTDRYYYTGGITAFAVTGGSASNVSVYVDGVEKNVADLTAGSTRTLRVVGNGTPTAYQVAVSGRLVKTDAASGDVVFGRRALGRVSKVVDTYRFTGDVTTFAVTEGSASNVSVYVDGDRVPLSAFASHP